MDKQAILDLAEAIKQTAAPTGTVSAVAFKAPPFWNTNARAWFLRLEAAFDTHSPPITNDKTRFQHVIQLLDSATSRRVQAVIENPAPQAMYLSLKEALLRAYEPTQLQKDTALLNLNGLGDRRPSEMLQYMRSLNTNTETLFRALFLNQLPPEVRRILAQNPDMNLDDLALTADRILEVDLPHHSTVAAANLNTCPQDTGCEHPEDAVDLNAVKKNTRSRLAPSPFTICHYHAQFGKKARRCEKFVNGKPCAMTPSTGQGNEKANRF